MTQPAQGTSPLEELSRAGNKQALALQRIFGDQPIGELDVQQTPYLNDPDNFEAEVLTAALPAQDLHAACRPNEFCRTPLHPGPCKGWKKKLKQIAPGVHDALEKTRKEKLAKKKEAKAKSELAKKKVATLEQAFIKAQRDTLKGSTAAARAKAASDQADLAQQLAEARKEVLDAEAEHDALLTPATAVKNAKKAADEAQAKADAASDRFHELDNQLLDHPPGSPETKAIMAEMTQLEATMASENEKAANASARLAALLEKMPKKKPVAKKVSDRRAEYEKRIGKAVCCQEALDDVDIDLAQLDLDLMDGENYKIGDRPLHQVHHGISTYKGEDYSGINEVLRRAEGDAKRLDEPDSYGDTWGEIIGAIDAAHSASRLSRDTQLWRGFKNPGKIFGGAWNETDVTGLEWTDHAFSSATTSEEVARGFASAYAIAAGDVKNKVVMRILAPAGAPAVQLSGYEYEAELLLERGARFRVVGDNGIKNGARYLDVELVK